MAEITMPAGDLEDVEIELDQNFQVNRSAWTGRRRVTGMPGVQKWYASATVPDIATEEDERPWRLFLLSLRGPLNWFRFPVACSQRAGSNPTVRAGGGPFTSLPLEGLPNSATVLKGGQYMTVPLPSGRHRLVMLTADLVTNGSGQGTATFVPELTETPTTGAIVETINPFLMAALTDSRQGWKLSNGVSVFQIVAEEAL
ncbi:hypothetical protein SLG_22190 [Sphingobium sp. SYK-6]|uniref:hypothetical protein n=1 Tax=Sphingobium sp. (strain NBRC 103272 / SYK-6) TaxID=627192 RepID=UPI000227713A|nr:hypothetical protein [Sphingobium sp. SYK-6]BAK66894.1 hypothetical protein SLG_22190 [Sphingobium sp. SYK-6]